MCRLPANSKSKWKPDKRFWAHEGDAWYLEPVKGRDERKGVLQEAGKRCHWEDDLDGGWIQTERNDAARRFKQPKIVDLTPRKEDTNFMGLIRAN